MPEEDISNNSSQIKVLQSSDRNAIDFMRQQASEEETDAPKHPDGSYWGFLMNSYETLGSVQALRTVTDPLIIGAYNKISGLFGGEASPYTTNERVSKENFEYAFNQATPQLRQDLTSLAENGYLSWDMPKSELDQLLDKTDEIRTRQKYIADYTQNWGTAHNLIASLPVMIADPLNYIPVGGAVNAIRSTAMKTRSIAAMLAAKTVFNSQPFVARAAFSAVKGAAIGGGYTAANNALFNYATNNIDNKPGLEDDANKILEGAGMGMAMFGTVAGIAHTVGYLDAKAMSSPRLRNLAIKGRTAFLDTQIAHLKAAQVDYYGEGGTKSQAETSLGKTGIGDDVAQNRRALTYFVDDATNGIVHDSGHGSNTLYLPVYKHIRQSMKNQIAAMRKAYKAEGKQFEIVDHPNQAHYEHWETVNKLLEMGRDRALEPGFQPSLLNLFNLMDGVNSKLSAWTGPDGAARRAAGGVFNELIDTLFTTSELTSKDAKLGGEISHNAEDISNFRNNSSKRLRNKIIGDFVKTEKRAPTQQELTSAVFEMYRRERLHKNLSGAIVDGDPSLSPGVNGIIANMEGWWKDYGVTLKKLKMIPDDAFTGDYFVPHMFSRDKVGIDRTAAHAAFVKQFEYQNSLTHANQTTIDAMVRLWQDQKKLFVKDPVSGARTNDSRSSILNWLTKESKFDTTGMDVGMNVVQFKNALESQELDFLPDPKGLLKLNPELHAEYQGVQRVIWNEAADRSIDGMLGENGLQAGKKERNAISTAVSTPDNLKRRVFFGGLVEELMPFVENNMESVLRRYSAQIDGEISVSQALQNNRSVGLLFRDPKTKLLRKPTNSQELLQGISDFRSAWDSLGSRLTANPKVSTGFNREIIQKQLVPIEAKLKSLIGQTHFVDNIERGDVQPWVSRNVQRMVMVIKGGSMAIPNLLDANTLAMENMRPGNVSRLGYSLMSFIPFIETLPKIQRRAALEGMAMFGDMLTMKSKRPMRDVNRGFGHGAVQNATEAVDWFLDGSTKRLLRWTGLDHLNAFTRNSSALLAWHDAANGARKLFSAMTAAGPGATEAAIRSEASKLGLTSYSIGRLSKLGINASNVEYVVNEMHQRGKYFSKDEPAIASSRDSFVKDLRPIYMDFADGAISKPEVFQRINEGIQSAARHYYNISPGVMNRPMYEDKYPALRILNQFQAFLSAYSSQRLRVMAQMPAHLSSGWFASHVIGGWLIGSAQRDLSGQQSFSDSIEQLKSNPAGAIYNGMATAGTLGVMQRPLGILEAGGVGPAQMLGVQYVGGASGAAMRDRADAGNAKFLNMIGASLGPTGGITRDLLEGGYNSLNNGQTKSEKMMLQRSLPLQNLLQLRLANWAYGKAVPSSPGGFIPLGSDYQRRENQHKPYK